MPIDDLFRNGPGPEAAGPREPISEDNIDPDGPPVFIAPKDAPESPRTLPGMDSQAWTDLLTRADVIMIEVGDLAHDAANAVLEVAFWSQDREAFQLVIQRLEKFVLALRRARQCRPYMTSPETQAKLSAVFDHQRSLESYDAREAFLAYVRRLWVGYVKLAGPFIQENHPDLL